MSDCVPHILEEIKLYLNEIAEKLWSGHAAIMVGAGFCKNAKTTNPAHKGFPDWNQLGDIFYEEIYGKKSKKDKRYLNVLKLAEEVQAAFGRPKLNQLLRSHIPDKSYEPSQLHVKLMELPWTDVFTTNYDTLLERACEKVEFQKFDVVINKDDLVYSEKPRIIKLHGSFPSQRPFIITEEDYRKYPKDFAPFVNTVQQSLLENTLCLIGFSGDDPNFLSWIGWIRDNIGKENSPKMYLIGIFDLSDAQKKLLEKRNIVLVDMSVCSNVKRDYAKAFDTFFKYLEFKKKNNGLAWPSNQGPSYPDSQKEIAPQLKAIIKKWENHRKTYPNWIVLPEDRRDLLWSTTEAWINIKPYYNTLETPLDINFIYELNWRLEKCLCPIFNNNIEIYRSITEKYNPFPDQLTIETASVISNDKSHKDSDWNEIKAKWIELQISMLRFYREEGYMEEWKAINNRIQKILSFLSPELVARVHYERCLHALFLLDIAEVKKQIKLWPENVSLPFWEAKRAALHAELGGLDIAEKILEKSLSSVRTQLNLSPISNDYLLVSREAYVMLLLRSVKDAIMFREGQYGKQEDVRQKFTERWNFLKQYKCDPWNELKIFGSELQREPVYTPTISEKHGFDIGKVSVIHHVCGTNSEALVAYTFLRYCEEVGIPFRMPRLNICEKSAKGALNRIVNYSLYWAFATFVRAGDQKSADIIFNRESIYKIPTKQIDGYIEDYLGVLQKAKHEIEQGDVFQNDNFGIVLASVIPEILSRLCMKCSTESKDKILDFVKELYLSNQKSKYKIGNLLRRLLDSYSKAELHLRLSTLLEFSIPIDLNVITKNEYPEPFYCIEMEGDFIAQTKEIKIEQSVIDCLLEKSASNNPEERMRAISRIGILYKLNLLNEKQSREFTGILWSQTDETTGFPKDTGYFKFAFLNLLPHPDSVDPVSLFKEYVLKEQILIQKTKKENGVSITGGVMPLRYEIIGATKSPLKEQGIDWSEEDVIRIFERLLKWWDSDKEFIKKDDDAHMFGSIGNEFKKRFSNLVQILKHVVIPRLSSETSMKTELNRLLKELVEYGVPCVAAHVASLNIFPEQRQDVFDRVEKAVLSQQEENIREGYNAISQIFILHKTRKIEDIPDCIWSFIQSPVKWRTLPNLIDAMNAGIHILNDFADTITDEFLEDIAFGLKYLIEETGFRSQQTCMGIAARLDARATAASLAYTLHKYYTNKHLPIPKTIQQWQAICDNEEEFSDIQNQWKDR